MSSTMYILTQMADGRGARACLVEVGSLRLVERGALYHALLEADAERLLVLESLRLALHPRRLVGSDHLHAGLLGLPLLHELLVGFLSLGGGELFRLLLALLVALGVLLLALLLGRLELEPLLDSWGSVLLGSLSNKTLIDNDVSLDIPLDSFGLLTHNYLLLNFQFGFLLFSMSFFHSQFGFLCLV